MVRHLLREAGILRASLPFLRESFLDPAERDEVETNGCFMLQKNGIFPESSQDLSGDLPG